VPGTVDPDLPEQRVVEAAALLPSFGGVTGWGALHWLGGVWFEGVTAGGLLRPVTLAIGGHDVRRQDGVAICHERLGPAELLEVDGLRTTSAVRATVFEMRYARDVREAVAVLDMAAYNDLVSIDEVVAYALDHPGWTGIPQCRRATLLADENSWSPQEVAMRLIWQLDAGLPRPLCNPPLFDRHGTHIGTPDLLDPVAGLIGEYDGAIHLEGARRRRDVRREERFRSHGLEVVTMLAGDGRNRFRMAERILEARRRALWQPPGERSWTITPPPWWVPSASVAQRRALVGVDRDRALRVRRTLTG
jgi:hypothetical protein